MRMHRAGGEQRVNRQQARRWCAIGQQHDDDAFTHRLRHFCTQAAQRDFEAFVFVVIHVELALLVGILRQAEDLPQLALRQYR